MENPLIDRERDSIQTRISIYHLWVFILSSGSGQYIIWLRILYVIVLQKIQVTIIITTQLSWSQFSIPFSDDHQRYSGCFLLENGNLLPIPSYLFGIINKIIATTSIKSIIISWSSDPESDIRFWHWASDLISLDQIYVNHIVTFYGRTPEFQFHVKKVASASGLDWTDRHWLKRT